MPLPKRPTPAEGTFPDRAPAGWQRRELAVWGAHGGAGTSTLAAWLQPAWDMGAMCPESTVLATVAQGRALVVVCRNTAWSAAQATKAVAAVSQQSEQVAVLAVVSDGWPEPAAARHRFRLLEPQVGAIVRIPFVVGLRLGDDPAEAPLPRRARRALAEVRAAASRSCPLP
jgi:hypothetical protein